MIAAIADWFVAIGTLCLAGATVWLVLVTKDMVQRSKPATRARTAAHRGLPTSACLSREPDRPGRRQGDYGGPVTWREVLPVRNGGPGVALNVRGTLYFPPPSGVSVQIVQTSIDQAS